MTATHIVEVYVPKKSYQKWILMVHVRRKGVFGMKCTFSENEARVLAERH